MAPLSSAHGQTAGPRVAERVRQALAASGRARVLITLRDPAPATAPDHERVAAVAAAQDAVVARLPTTEFTAVRRYRTVPGLAGIITQRALEILQADPTVTSIEVDEPGGAHLRVSVPAIRANIVHARLGILGQGVTAAVLDTGVETRDTELTVVAQQCFTQSACPPGKTSTGSSAQDDNAHGSNVASILASNGSVYAPGFAPATRLVAVKVLDGDERGLVSDWIAGLDYVAANRVMLDVRVVNMSLGTDTLFNGTCDAQQSLFASAVAQLTAMNVVVFASSGNAGSSTSLPAPACLSGVIAVGATYKTDVGRQPNTGTYRTAFGSAFADCVDNSTTLQTVTCFTNSGSRLDILAPGAPIETYGLNDKLWTYWGTSQASPTAAGVASLMLQMNSSLTPAQIASMLKISGPRLTDPKNGLQFTQIDALNAVQLVLPVTTSVTVSPPTVAVGQTLMVSGAVTNPGLSGSGDLYIGLIRPDGSILFFLGTGGTTVGSLADLGSFRPYASGVSLAAPFAASAPNFYATSRASGDPRGGYVFFVLAVKSGPLSGGTLPPDRLLGLATATFSYP